MPDEQSAFDLDEAIRDSHRRVRRHDQLTGQRHGLVDLRDAVQERIAGFEREFAEEKRDVERLERGGFNKLIADLAGGRETKLATERVEAEAAWQKLEGERARLGQVNTDLATLDAELAALGDARHRYDHAVKRKAQLLAEGGDPRGRDLAALHDEYMTVDADLREHNEAYQAGMAAGSVMTRMHDHLGLALRHSRKDVASEFFLGDALGVGVFADYYERKHALAADELVWLGQQALDTFSRELGDIGVKASVQLPRVSTRWFADLFLDNIVFDWTRHKRLRHSLEEVDEITRWLVDMARWLKNRCDELTATRDSLTSRRDHLLANG